MSDGTFLPSRLFGNGSSGSQARYPDQDSSSDAASLAAVNTTADHVDFFAEPFETSAQSTIIARDIKYIQEDEQLSPTEKEALLSVIAKLMDRMKTIHSARTGKRYALLNKLTNDIWDELLPFMGLPPSTTRGRKKCINPKRDLVESGINSWFANLEFRLLMFFAGWCDRIRAWC